MPTLHDSRSSRRKARHVFTEGGVLSPKRAFNRILASIVAGGLVAGALVVGAVVAPAMADTLVTLEATSDSSILAGETASITLKATGSSSTDLYNVAVRYELPAGVTYVAGSASGADEIGMPEPTIVTIVDQAGPPAITHQVLIWSNLVDLPRNLAATLSFAVQPDPAVFPVGSSFSGQASVYAPSNPRKIVKFSPTTGVAQADASIASDATVGGTTKINAIEVEKSEPSPEHELMRGVHDQTTTYTLSVRNTGVAATDDVVVVDYLPAGLEFLDCGGVDNSTTGDEYLGSGPLGTTPAVPDSECAPAGTTLTKVETVQLAANEVGKLGAGVYTKVTWNVGTIQPGTTSSITYAAGIPLRENALWTGAAPGAESLTQASNLDNNTGPSTRQQEPAKAGQGLTNTVVATGNYTGAVEAGTDRVVTASDSLTVRAMDLSIVKSVSTVAGDGSFTSEGLAEFTLLLRASEYTDDSAMTITDIIPNGLCPLVPGGVSGDGCKPANTITGATVVSTTQNADGTYTLVMEPTMVGVTLAANTSHTITYQALMGAEYKGTSTPGTGTGVPTAVGDSFTNTVSIAGTTTDVTAAQAPAVVAVTDDSKAAIVPTAPTINKRVLTRPTTNGAALDCANPPSPSVYTESDVPGYQLGDTVCFELTVNFSSSAVTRNAVITDFVPVGTAYVGYSVDPAFTPAVVAVSGTEAAKKAETGTDPAAWHLGDRGTGGNRYVPMGEKLTMYVKALVTDASAIADVDITANLMKYRQENTAGTVFALRDAADYSITTPRLSLDKSYVAPSGTDLVKERDVVPFTLTVTNNGTAGKDHDFAVENVDLWDLLPVGLDCSTVSAEVPAATCFDYGKPGHPANSLEPSNAERSIVVWTIPGPILAGTSVSVTYNVTIPAEVSVSTVFTNNASVVKFTSPNTSGTHTEYFPTGSLNIAAKGNVPAANAAATVAVARAKVTKTAKPNLPGANKTATEVVAGETVDYTYSVTVPAGSTVYNGLLSDTLPPGMTLPGSPGKITALLDGKALPVGFTLTDGNLTFPPVWNNTTPTDRVFTVTIVDALVGVGLSTGGLENTAKFTSSTDKAGKTALPDRTASATVSVVVPKPTLSKTIDKASAGGGEVVTYTLVAGNTEGAPAAFDAVVVDCLPAGLTFKEFISSADAATASTDGTGTGVGGNGCAIGSTKLSWTLPTTSRLLFPNEVTFTFSALIGTSAVGLTSYSNVATVTASTVANGTNDGSVEKIVSATSNAATVAVAGATTVKVVDKPKATIGESVAYQIDVTIPANVRFYNAAIIDTLPAGIAAGAAVVTCVQAGGPCTGLQASGTALAPKADGTIIGWLLGSVASVSTERVVTVRFTGTVTSLAGNTAGRERENQASLVWNAAEKGDPTSAENWPGGSPDERGNPGKVTITITEPKLSIAKSADNTTPEPGELVTYTVTVANANLDATSAAHNATVVDTIPAGIDISSVTAISSGGVINTAGRTITWTIAQLDTGASTAFTYSAKLAPSPTLGTTGVVNTVTVPSYSSLASGGREYTESPSATATVTPEFPHVTVAKSVAEGAIAYVGSPFGWTVTLANTGLGTAATVVAIDRLPKHWEYTAGSGTVSVNGAAALPLADPAVVTARGVQTLTWAAFPNLAAGRSIVISYTAAPAAGVLNSPGAGQSVAHTNRARAVATDATGATTNALTGYTDRGARATAYIHEADVAIVKTAGASLVAGTTTSSAWTLTVSNKGPDTAVGTVAGGNFVVTDTPTLPTGVTIAGVSGTGWTCTPPTSTGAFSCARDDATETLASKASFPVITVAAATAASVATGTSVPNSATVAAKTHDSTPSNNADDDPNVVSTRADLALVKTITTTAPVAGGSITWSLAPSNVGPSVSRGVITVTDVVPAGVNSALATGTGWECNAQPADAGEAISCEYTANGGVMSVGAAGALTVTGTIDSSYVGGAIANTAQIDPGTTTDPTPANNGASVTSVTPSTATTVSVQKSLVSPTPALIPGDEAVYEISVTNTGTADARAVTVTDVLPAGMTYSSKTDVTGVWTCTGTTTVSCALTGTLSALATKKTATVRLHVATASNLSTAIPIVNTAVAVAANAPATSGDTSTGLVGKADLSISKSHTGAVVAGTNLDYRLLVTNNGPSDSPGTIVVTDSVPAGLVPTVATGTGWDCVIGAPDPTTKLTPVTCEHDTMLAASAVADAITITVAIPADLAAQTLVNTATVDGPLDDPTPSNNTATDPATITTVAALDITKDVASSGPFVAGTTLDYTVRVTNSGPSVANLVSVSDVVPTGLSITAITGVDWTCSVSTATCDRAVLPLGSYDITVTALIDSAVADGTALTNQAVLTWTDTAGSHTDDDPADVTVTARADLALAKTAVDASAKAVTLFTAGEQARYLLQATNHGPSAAIAPLQITDQLPVGLSYLGLEDSLDWACVAGPIDASGQTVDCSWAGTAALAAGAAAHPLTMLVQVDAAMGAGAVTNTATVSSPTVDDDPTSNTDDETVAIAQLADLSITKTHSGSVRIGDSLAFDLEVRNAGPSLATGVVVTDALPVGLEFVDVAGSDPAWSCVAATADANGTVVTCELTVDIAPGDTAPALSITAIVRPAAYPTVVNVATVASTTPDSDLGNNTADDSVTVPALASLTVTKHSTGTLRVGETGNYRITVSNAGPTENPDTIVITDDLPDGLAFASAQGDGVECAAKSQKVSCTTVGPLAVGDTVTIDLQVNVREAAYPSVTNTVTVESKTEQAPDAQLADSDTTVVAQAIPLAHTGIALALPLLAAILSLMLGAGMLLWRRGRLS